MLPAKKNFVSCGKLAELLQAPPSMLEEMFASEQLAPEFSLNNVRYFDEKEACAAFRRAMERKCRPHEG